jgi:hypothetical protein
LGRGGGYKIISPLPFPFSGVLDGGIVFKIVFWELHMQYLICTEGEVHTEFSWADPREGEHSEDLGVDGRIIMK